MMMRAIGLLLFLASAAAPQDDCKRWVEALGDDDVARRAEAEEALRRAGPKALPALEKAAHSSDLDVADRARRLVRGIKDDEERQRVLGPARRVTVQAQGIPFQEVLGEIDRQAGFTTACAAEVERRPVSIEIIDRPYLEALDRVCEAHAGAHVEPRCGAEEGHRGSPGEEARAWVEIRGGASAVKPTAYAGPFRLRLEGIFLRRPSRTEVTYSVVWQPNVRPILGPSMIVDEARDDRGVDLVGDVVRQQNAESRAPRASISRYLWTRSSVRFDPLPSIEAGRLARFRGTVRLGFPLEEAVLEFEPKEVGAKKVLADFEVEFTAWTVGDSSVTARFTNRRRDARAGEYIQECPFGSSQIRILDAEGKDLPYAGSSGSYAPGLSVLSRDARIEKDRPPARIRTPALVRWFHHEVAFDFRDVPLPQW